MGECPKCGQPARPAILMFNDGEWRDNISQSSRWDAWQDAVKRIAAQKKLQGGALKIAILEIGAGGNVTTVRSTSERFLTLSRDAGCDAKLIRVNPDLPLGDDYRLRSGHYVVSVMAGGL